MMKGVLLVAAAIIQGVIAAAVTEEGTVGARVPGLEEDGAPFVSVLSPGLDISMCLAPGVPVSMRFKAHPGVDRSMACENYHFVIFLDGTMVGLARATPFHSSIFCEGAWTLAPVQLGSHQLQVVFRDAFDYEYSVGLAMAHLDVRVLKDMEHTSTGGGEAESCHYQRLRSDSMQFMPRDELEAKAWSAAGFYADSARAGGWGDVEGVVVVVVANYGFRDMLANWMCHANRLGLRYLVGLVDSEVEVWMKRHYPDVHTHLLLNDSDGKRMKEDTTYMSWEMLRIVWSCHLLVLHLLARGLSVLYMDVDVVLLADPVAAVRHSCDFLYQQNHCGAVPSRHTLPHTEPNAGLYFVRPSLIATEILEELKRKVEQGPLLKVEQGPLLSVEQGPLLAHHLPPHHSDQRRTLFFDKQFCIQKMLWDTLKTYDASLFFSPPLTDMRMAKDCVARGLAEASAASLPPRLPNSGASSRAVRECSEASSSGPFGGALRKAPAICALDAHEFATGWALNRSNFEVVKTSIVALHATCVIGRRRKVEMLKELGLWLVSRGADEEGTEGDAMICSRQQLVPQESGHKDVSKAHSSGAGRAWRDQHSEHAVGYLAEDDDMGGGSTSADADGGGGASAVLPHGGSSATSSQAQQAQQGGGGSPTSPHAPHAVPVMCRKGSKERVGSDERSCSVCEAGTYSSSDGAKSCDACPAGTYTETSGATACSVCQAGTYAGTSGATACLACAAGTYGGSSGATGCLTCGGDTYSQGGAVTCSQCPPRSVTYSHGATSRSWCVCAAGYTRLGTSGGGVVLSARRGPERVVLSETHDSARRDDSARTGPERLVLSVERKPTHPDTLSLAGHDELEIKRRGERGGGQFERHEAGSEEERREGVGRSEEAAWHVVEEEGGSEVREEACSPCSVGKYKGVIGNGPCFDCGVGKVYQAALCFDTSCSDLDLERQVGALHVVEAERVGQLGTRDWCVFLTEVLGPKGEQGGDACRQVLQDNAYADQFFDDLYVPVIMQTLLTSCCICGGGTRDNPSVTPPGACQQFERGQKSCRDDAVDALAWGCCFCGFGQQLAAESCGKHYVSELHHLSRFASASANDGRHKELYFASAGLYIPQLIALLDHTNKAFDITPTMHFANDDQERLADLFRKYGSDKASKHTSYVIYSYILQELGLNASLRVLEVGLGTQQPHLLSTMHFEGGSMLQPGGSLRAFRDYLPHAHIYGADYDRQVLFEEARITTAYVDQMDYTTFLALNTSLQGRRFHLVVDDGLHSIGANLNTLIFALEQLEVPGWVVIEDIHLPDNWRNVKEILDTAGRVEVICGQTGGQDGGKGCTVRYRTYMVRDKFQHLFVVHKHYV